MNRTIETATIKRETTACSHFIPGLDILTGDLVQIVADGRDAAGRLGRVIGVRVAKGPKGVDTFLFRVQLSNLECIEVTGRRLRLLNENGRSEVK